MASETPIEKDARGSYRRLDVRTAEIGIDTLPYPSPDFPTDRDVRITGYATGIPVGDIRFRINEVVEIDFFGLKIRFKSLFPLVDEPVADDGGGDWHADILADTLDDNSLYEFVAYADIHARAVDLDSRPMGQPPVKVAKSRSRLPARPAKSKAAISAKKKAAKKK